jgi:hypothetical protein
MKNKSVRHVRREYSQLKTKITKLESHSKPV